MTEEERSLRGHNRFSAPLTTTKLLLFGGLAETRTATMQRSLGGIGGTSGGKKTKKGGEQSYVFRYKGRRLQEFVVPQTGVDAHTTRRDVWVDCRGAYGGEWGLQEGGRPASITVCLHGLQEGQRLVLGVGGAGIKGSGVSGVELE